MVGSSAKLQTSAEDLIPVQERVQTQVTARERPEAQWDQSGFAKGSGYIGQVRRSTGMNRSRMEESLRESSKACKIAAAVIAEWIRDTQRSLQKQRLWRDSIEQEVRNQQERIRNLAGVVVDHEDRLQLLKRVVRQEGRALVELKAKHGGRAQSQPRANLSDERPRDPIKVEKITPRKDSSSIEGAVGESLSAKGRQPSRRNSSEVGRGPGTTSAANTDPRIRGLLDILDGQIHELGQRKDKKLSVSFAADTSDTGSGKVEGAQRTSLSKLPQTPTKGESITKGAAVKRKATEPLEGEAKRDSQTREPGGGKAARLLLKAGTSLQALPVGKSYWTEAGKKSRETKKPGQVRRLGGAIQQADPGAGQPPRHSEHVSKASSHSRRPRSVKSPIRGQEVAGSVDTSAKRAEGGSFK